MGRLWKFLLVIFIVVMIFFPVLAPAIASWLSTAGFTGLAGVVTAIGTLPWWATAAAGLGLAYALDPSTTTSIISDAGKLAGSVVGAVGSAVGAGVSALSSSILPLLLGGVAIFFLLSKGKKDKQPVVVESTQLPPRALGVS